MSACSSLCLRRMLRSLFLPAVALLASSLPSDAQAPPRPDPYSTGREFVIAFPDTVRNIAGPDSPNPMKDILSLIIYSADSNDVTITGRSFSRRVKPLPGKFITVGIEDHSTITPNAVADAIDRISPNTFRVSAQKPIILYCYMMTTFGGEMWTPIPVERWGMEYFVAAVPGDIVKDMRKDSRLEYVASRSKAPAQVTIIAAYDGTTVTVYPPPDLVATPSTVKLNANQAYTIRSTVDTLLTPEGTQLQQDIGGMRIVADRPIGVISGNTRSHAVPELTNAISTELLNSVTANGSKNLLAEWLSPVDQLGTEFVYMPTWDARQLTGEKIENPEKKRKEEIVRAYGASREPGRILYRLDSTRVDTGALAAADVKQYTIAATAAHYFRTEKPAQVMMHSAALATTRGNITDALMLDFDTWGAYMVELVPREQWSTFAPYFAPPYPFETEHFVSVVADTNALDMIYNDDGSPFEFNRGVIPGTDLMWGTMRITADRTHYLHGRHGTRFFAYAYGLRQGIESYQYMGNPQYYEEVALSYGYPLAPRRRILRPGDSLRIDTSWSSCVMYVSIRTLNDDPVGLYSAVLEPGSRNASLSISIPAGPAGIVGVSTAELRIEPIDHQQDASAVLLLTDRTGKAWRIPFDYDAERIEFGAGTLFDFGEINTGATSDSMLVLQNGSNRPVCIRRVAMQRGTQRLSIRSAEPSGPELDPPQMVMLLPGETLRLQLRASPQQKGRVYIDSLVVGLCCSEQSLAVRAGGAVPCLMIGDLDFGELEPNQMRTMELELCNRGSGVVSFAENTPADVMSWIVEKFMVERKWLDSLRRVRLEAGQCVRIPVSFTSEHADTFETVARIFANTRDCRDTSIWRAVVREGEVAGADKVAMPENMLGGIIPNPASGLVEIRFATATSSRVRLAIYDLAGELIEEIIDRPVEAGGHMVTWDASEVSAGTYYCRLTAGDWSAVRSIVVSR